MGLAQESGLFGDRARSLAFARAVLEALPELTGAYFGYEPDADGHDAERDGGTAIDAKRARRRRPLHPVLVPRPHRSIAHPARAADRHGDELLLPRRQEPLRAPAGGRGHRAGGRRQPLLPPGLGRRAAPRAHDDHRALRLRGQVHRRADRADRHRRPLRRHRRRRPRPQRHRQLPQAPAPARQPPTSSWSAGAAGSSPRPWIRRCAPSRSRTRPTPTLLQSRFDGAGAPTVERGRPTRCAAAATTSPAPRSRPAAGRWSWRWRRTRSSHRCAAPCSESLLVSVVGTLIVLAILVLLMRSITAPRRARRRHRRRG